MTPSDCDKFQTCNAAVCPLDPDWRRAVHLPGERVCPYLLASGKAGAADHYRDDRVFRVVLPLVGEVCERHPDIGRKVARAALTGVKRGGFGPRDCGGSASGGAPLPGHPVPAVV